MSRFVKPLLRLAAKVSPRETFVVVYSHPMEEGLIAAAPRSVLENITQQGVVGLMGLMQHHNVRATKYTGYLHPDHVATSCLVSLRNLSEAAELMEIVQKHSCEHARVGIYSLDDFIAHNHT